MKIYGLFNQPSIVGLFIITNNTGMTFLKQSFPWDKFLEVELLVQKRMYLKPLKKHHSPEMYQFMLPLFRPQFCHHFTLSLNKILANVKGSFIEIN